MQVRCKQCKKDIDSKLSVKVVPKLRKGFVNTTDRELILCITCAVDFSKQNIKKVSEQNNKQVEQGLMGAGMWQSGMRPIDIYSDLEKWTKGLKNSNE